MGTIWVPSVPTRPGNLGQFPLPQKFYCIYKHLHLTGQRGQNLLPKIPTPSCLRPGAAVVFSIKPFLNQPPFSPLRLHQIILYRFSHSPPEPSALSLIGPGIFRIKLLPHSILTHPVILFWV